ncbi:Hpt domain-containing protein, partial [Neosynechococcus sphagnicola]|uniref:Hpt domain-containing protein n=1 Tax=Neosynechococcus sphagnicola TaxID=1501145 RepID=UPI001EF9F5A8
MTETGRDIKELSLWDLFRLEVQTQIPLVRAGLSALDEGTSSPSVMEAGLSATRTIQGIAKLLEVEAAVNLASGLETSLVALPLTSRPSDQFATLWRGLDWLHQISQVEETELPDWLAANQPEIASTLEAIAHDLHPGQRPSPPELPLEIAIASLPLAVPESAPREIAEATPEEPASLGDTSMLDLFRLEVEAQANILNTGLLALEAQTHSPQALESLMRAAHSIKGAARVVSIDAAVHLAHVMEDCFVAAQNQKVMLDADDIDQLLQGVDLLLGISQTEPSDLQQWLHQQQETLDAAKQRIAAILMVAKKPSSFSSPPPPSALVTASPLPLTHVPPKDTSLLPPSPQI